MTTHRVPAAAAGPAPDGGSGPEGGSGPALTFASSRGPSLLARRPEIVPITSTVLAWAALAAMLPLSAWITAGDDAPGQLPGLHAGHSGIFTPSGLSMVAMMTVAMMAPLGIPGVRTTAFTSPWWRAGRAAAWFFTAYIATWIVFAVCLAPIAEMLAGVLGSATLAAAILSLACAVAQLDPHRTGLSRSCDRPMRLRGGTEANSDCARFGLLTASRGVRLCALPMLAMLAVPSSLLVMAVLTVLSVTDRVTQGSRRLPIAASYVVLAAVLLMTV